VTTPFTGSGDLDLPAARRLFALAAATTGSMFVAGTTGEFPVLEDAERLALIETALAEAGPPQLRTAPSCTPIFFPNGPGQEATPGCGAPPGRVPSVR